MNQTPLSWRLFRLLCIVQLILIAFPLVTNVVRLFDGAYFWTYLINIVCYTLVFLFVYQGMTLINYNYPDNPLTVPQKRRFNLLFLANFLLIAFMFSKVVSEWWVIPWLYETRAARFAAAPWVLTSFLLNAFAFIFHLLFLWGMFRLRQLIHKNTVTQWVNQFGPSE